jgi:uncharacterized protein (TIGR00369 family)
MKAPRNADWEAQVRESFERQGFMRLIGAEIVALAPGRCSIALPASEHVTQQRGFLHGGVTAAIADTAAGFAAYSLMPANSSPLTVEYKINLMAPGVGERFVAAAEVVRSGRTLTVVECSVSAEAGGRSVEMARMLATLICLQDTPDVPPARGAAAT